MDFTNFLLLDNDGDQAEADASGPYVASNCIDCGQGEGQLRIDRSVWGFYINDTKTYRFVLEEGVLSFEEASVIVIGVLDQIRSVWGSHIESEGGVATMTIPT